jgi:ActR/RegA family two-component response regulator
MRSKSGPQSSAERHAREIRRHTRKRYSSEEKIRIIFIMSYPDLRATSSAVRLGADGVIAKPLTIDEIEHQLKRPFGAHEPLPGDIMLPEPASDVHMVEFFEKNDGNVMRIAQSPAIHRRTSQWCLVSRGR